MKVERISENVVLVTRRRWIFWQVQELWGHIGSDDFDWRRLSDGAASALVSSRLYKWRKDERQKAIVRAHCDKLLNEVMS